MGRRSRKAGAPRSVPADRARGDLPGAHRRVAGRRPPLHLLPHARGARRRAPGGAGREATLGLRRRLPRPARRRGRPPQGRRRALDVALQGASRHGHLRRPAARPGRGRMRDHRRLHRAAFRRDHHLQSGRGGRRRHDGDQPRHPRRRPHLQHAQADPHLRGAGRARAALPAHAAAVRHRSQEALQAPRRDQSRAAHGHGVPGRGGAQLPLLPVDRVRRVDDHLEPRRPRRPPRRREPGDERQHLRSREAALDERALRARHGAGRLRGARAGLSRAGGLLRSAAGPEAARRAGRERARRGSRARPARAHAARRRPGAPDGARGPARAGEGRGAGRLHPPGRLALHAAGHRRRSAREAGGRPRRGAHPAGGRGVPRGARALRGRADRDRRAGSTGAARGEGPSPSSPRCAWA